MNYWDKSKANLQRHGEHGGFIPLWTWNYKPKKIEDYFLALKADRASNTGTGDVSWSIRVTETDSIEPRPITIAVITVKKPQAFHIQELRKLNKGRSYQVQWGLTGEKVRDNYRYYIRASGITASIHRVVRGKKDKFPGEQ